MAAAGVIQAGGQGSVTINIRTHSSKDGWRVSISIDETLLDYPLLSEYGKRCFYPIKDLAGHTVCHDLWDPAKSCLSIGAVTWTCPAGTLDARIILSLK